MHKIHSRRTRFVLPTERRLFVSPGGKKRAASGLQTGQQQAGSQEQISWHLSHRRTAKKEAGIYGVDRRRDLIVRLRSTGSWMLLRSSTAIDGVVDQTAIDEGDQIRKVQSPIRTSGLRPAGLNVSL